MRNSAQTVLRVLRYTMCTESCATLPQPQQIYAVYCTCVLYLLICTTVLLHYILYGTNGSSAYSVAYPDVHAWRQCSLALPLFYSFLASLQQWSWGTNKDRHATKIDVGEKKLLPVAASISILVLRQQRTAMLGGNNIFFYKERCRTSSDGTVSHSQLARSCSSKTGTGEVSISHSQFACSCSFDVARYVVEHIVSD